MKLNVKELIEFFDLKDDTKRKHSSAINGMIGEHMALCLLSNYISEQQNLSCEILFDQGIPIGQNSEHWLDAWVLKEEKLLYQVEIKNWCAHSKGGEELKLDASDTVYSNYAKKMWKKQWNEENCCFKDDTVNKVLEKMKKPECYISNQIEPLICFWFVIHPKGEKTPFFTVDIDPNEFNHNEFKHVNVFSMSAYLRYLYFKNITDCLIKSPQLQDRYNFLKQLLCLNELQ